MKQKILAIQSDAAEPKAPSVFLALTELPRALAELSAFGLVAPMLAKAPRGDGHPVLVLPGLGASDAAMAMLRHYLIRLGYDAHAWELGRNLGPKAIGDEGERLVARLQAVYDQTGKRVSIVGWSLGGMMARQLSRRAPGLVRQVITLGSPFAGSPHATNVWRIYQALTGELVDSEGAKAQLRESAAPPPVPSTSIFSRRDGIVAWQNCLEPAGPETDNIEVHGSHCGLAVNPSVLYAIADRLAQADGDWHPFERTGLKAMVYPSAGHD
jgi:pimeloyl-ACP methyl ester carboxylesterase